MPTSCTCYDLRYVPVQDTVELRRRIESAHESISGQASQLTTRLLNLDGGAQTPQAKKISSDFRVRTLHLPFHLAPPAISDGSGSSALSRPLRECHVSEVLHDLFLAAKGKGFSESRWHILKGIGISDLPSLHSSTHVASPDHERSMQILSITYGILQGCNLLMEANALSSQYCKFLWTCIIEEHLCPSTRSDKPGLVPPCTARADFSLMFV